MRDTNPPNLEVCVDRNPRNCWSLHQKLEVASIISRYWSGRVRLIRMWRSHTLQEQPFVQVELCGIGRNFHIRGNVCNNEKGNPRRFDRGKPSAYIDRNSSRLCHGASLRPSTSNTPCSTPVICIYLIASMSLSASTMSHPCRLNLV